MESPTLSKNLLYQRKLKGFSQEKLSELSGVTVRTIQRIERGEVNSHMQTVKLLAAALEVGIQDLIPLENPKEEATQTKWLLLIHSVPLLGSVIPLTNVLIPIFIWIHKREDSRVYDEHCRAVINFQLTITLLFLICLLGLLFPFWRESAGEFFSIVPLYFGVIIFNIVFIVLNIFRVLSTGRFYYPLSIPFFSRSWHAKA